MRANVPCKPLPSSAPLPPARSAPRQPALPAPSASTARGRRRSPKSPACRPGRAAALSAQSALMATSCQPMDSTRVLQLRRNEASSLDGSGQRCSCLPHLLATPDVPFSGTSNRRAVWLGSWNLQPPWRYAGFSCLTSRPSMLPSQQANTANEDCGASNDSHLLHCVPFGLSTELQPGRQEHNAERLAACTQGFAATGSASGHR